MRSRIILALLTTATLAGGLLLAACGGGDDGAGKGQRITDPAAVPSSTPIQSPVVYHYSGDIVSTSGGQATVSAGSSVTPAGSSKTYTIQSGDNCAGIAGAYNITVDALKAVNRTINADCTNLKAGETLKIPAVAATAQVGSTVGGRTPTPKPSGKEYTVQAGDNCGTIASSYGVDVARLIQFNNLDANCANLKIGQVVRIP